MTHLAVGVECVVVEDTADSTIGIGGFRLGHRGRVVWVDRSVNVPVVDKHTISNYVTSVHEHE